MRAGFTGLGLELWAPDPATRSDTVTSVKLPDERSGTFMVFKTFDRLSYGLVMEATDIIRVQDRVENP